MFLNFCDNCALYTLKKACPKCNAVSRSAHPARFSPDDKYSRQRITLKERYNLLPTQQPPKEY